MDKDVEVLTHRVEQLIEDNQERNATLQATVDEVAKDIASINKILIVGNGQPALTVRMAVVETKAEAAIQQIASMKFDQDGRQIKYDDRKWQTILVCLSCIISFLIAIIPHILAALLKH